MSSRPPHGFTLVEVLVVLPALILTITVVMAFMITYFSQLLVKNGLLEMETQAQLALYTMRDDLFHAVAFTNTNDVDLPDPNKPTGWNAIGTNSLLVYESAYDKPRQLPERRLVYKADAPNECASEAIIQNQYSTNLLAYYVKNNNLYRHTLIPNQANNCWSTFRTATCPPEAATPTCPADPVIAENVKSFQLIYHKARDAGTFTTAELQAHPEYFIQVSRVQITLVLGKDINAEPYQVSASIDIKKVE